jgi:hypothetical protein
VKAKRRLQTIALLFVSVLLLCAQSIPHDAVKVLVKAEKHYSPEKKQFLQIVEYSATVPADESGILLYDGVKARWITIPSLVGVGFVDWSPDSEYVLIDSGTYAIRAFQVISTQTGKRVGKIDYLAKEFGWLSPRVVASTTSQGTRAGNVIDRFGVSFFTISQDRVVRKDVLAADELTDYNLLKTAEGKLKARRTIYKNTGTESPWERYKPSSDTELELPTPN